MNSYFVNSVLIVESSLKTKTIYIMDNNLKKEATEQEEKYRGVDVNKADDGKVSEKMVKEDTKELNNNPRNNDMQ